MKIARGMPHNSAARPSETACSRKRFIATIRAIACERCRAPICAARSSGSWIDTLPKPIRILRLNVVVSDGIAGTDGGNLFHGGEFLAHDGAFVIQDTDEAPLGDDDALEKVALGGGAGAVFVSVVVGDFEEAFAGLAGEEDHFGEQAVLDAVARNGIYLGE